MKPNLTKEISIQDLNDYYWLKEELHRKKDPSYKKKIAAQFEYNQFTRDFYAETKNNKGKSRQEAIDAWNRIKKLPGSNKYKFNNWNIGSN